MRAHHPSRTELAVGLGQNHARLAKLCVKHDQPDEAAKWKERATATLEAAMEHKPKNSTARNILAELSAETEK